jgi:hypothetical protein
MSCDGHCEMAGGIGRAGAASIAALKIVRDREIDKPVGLMWFRAGTHRADEKAENQCKYTPR